MPSEKTGWERENRTHFDEIVVNYDSIRPEYPDQMIEDILRYVGPDRGKAALEIGAGTGKATRHFLRAGYDVTAVEAGAGMAAFLRDRFRDREDFRVIVAPFEDATLYENHYDLLYAASAFHWVDAEIGCPKAFRLLKPGGVFALLRYNYVTDDGNALYEQIQALYEIHFRSHYPSRTRPIHRTEADYKKPCEVERGYGFRDLADYGFTDITMKFYFDQRMLTADEYIRHLDTHADHRGLPEANRAALYQGIREAIREHGGMYPLKHTFQSYIGRK